MKLNREELDRVQIALDALWQTLCSDKGVMPLETQRCYALALEDLGADAIETACRLAMRNCKWFPKPVELREMVCGTIGQQAEAAWLKVVQAIEDHGGYASVSFDDPVISHAINACGGWMAICEKPETWLRKDFIAVYRELAGKAVQPVKLLGIHARNNGQKSGQVAKIGSHFGSVPGIEADKRHLTHDVGLPTRRTQIGEIVDSGLS